MSHYRLKSVGACALAVMLLLTSFGSCGKQDPPAVTDAVSTGETMTAGTVITETGTANPVPGTDGDEETTALDPNSPKEGPFVLTSELDLPAFDGIHAGVTAEKQTIAFEGFGAGKRAFSTYRGTPAYEDGRLIFPAGQVTDTIFPVQNDEKGKTVYRLTIRSDTPADYAPWETLFIGLRLENARKDATEHTGVWLAFRGDEIGMRTGNWPSTAYMPSPLSFSSGRTILIEDDAVQNILTVSGVNDEGQIVPLAVVRIRGNRVEMYPPRAAEPAISDTLARSVPAAGYTSLWAHIPKNEVHFQDISMELTVKTVDGAEDYIGGRPLSRDLWSDTWVATDEILRTVAGSERLPNDRKVGIFYFLWHEETNQPIYDHNRAYLEGGREAMLRTIADGPLGFAHYWAEPYFGYYCSNDEWVLRKHAAELSAAGVDFVYLDATNGALYEPNLDALLRVWGQMRTEGLETPDICFLMKGSDQAEFNTLWDAYYSTGRYFDLWFRWNGKPLLLLAQNTSGDPVSMTEEQKDFFTIRYSWAMTRGQDWYENRRGIDCWPWAEKYPQGFGLTLNEQGKRVTEQMCVMCGFWANGTFGIPGGRSYTHKKGIPETDRPWDFGYGLMDSTTGQGLAFQEGFDRAIEKCPPVIMVTGYNEWWAGRWEGAPAIGQTIGGEYHVSKDPSVPEHNYYVDNLCPEYSRDIEAMKGGFGDNYYYQLAGNVRAYKGARALEPAFGQWAIDLDGSVGQWFTVGPEYRDAAFDTAHRNHPSAVGQLTYTNDTGRNDIVTAKVSNDAENWYFYAECREELISDEGKNWMNLFIKADGDEQTGWHGFDYILNRTRDGERLSVERFISTGGANGFETESVGTARYRARGKILQIQVEKSLLPLGASFDFKWADHSVSDGEIMEFIDRGDTAPDGRFCYRYTTEAAPAPALPDTLPADAVVLKVNSYNAFVGGEAVRLGDSTKTVTLSSGRDIWLPVDFIGSALGLEVTGETYDHYGVKYAKAAPLIEAAGRVLTFTSDGLVVIAKDPVEDASLLTILYRTLH